MTKEQKQFIAKCKKEGFDDNQTYQICKGFDCGFSIEQVKIYAKKEFDFWQMFEIRYGFQVGLTIEQISLYARQEFNANKMEKIRKMFHKYKKFSTVQKKVALMILES